MLCLWIAERLFARDERQAPFGKCGTTGDRTERRCGKET